MFPVRHTGGCSNRTVYYGAADTYTALAFTTVEELYDFMLQHNKLGETDGVAVK